ncbi:MAG: orotate phosphoribosyltransferase [Candidatus Firestonebacteria bacterium]
MINQDEILKIFKDAGALLTGHFKLTSGLHSGTYLEKFKVLQYPKYTEILCKEIAERFKDDNIEVVIGPVTGGVILAYEVAKQLNVRGIFTEREEGKMTLKRDFEIKHNERVLIVEDIITTGGSVMEIVNLVKELNGDIVGVGLLIDRSGDKVDFGVRKEALATLNVENFRSEKCPLCKKGIPLTKRGSRK